MGAALASRQAAQELPRRGGNSMSALQQIRWNAAWVAENIGKQSGIEPFAYTAESVRYLEQFLVRQEALG